MRNSIIVAADGARGRIYGVVRRSNRNRLGLEELEDLVNPEGRLRDGEIYAENRPGIKQDQGTGVRAGMDEHRQDHELEMQRRFAADLIDAAARHAASRGAVEVILVAGPEMLGILRAATDRLDQEIQVKELGKQLTQTPADELYDRLAGENLLPPPGL